MALTVWGQDPTLMTLKDLYISSETAPPALQEALYSGKLRSFMREVTGCGELSDKIDCSCNVYADGGHLLCHDDVIGGCRAAFYSMLLQVAVACSGSVGLSA